MDHYRDLRILADPEFPVQQLRDALFAKLHRALVVLQANAIGLSFPEWKVGQLHLGGLLRLHGSASALEDLAPQDWLSGMRDHLTQTPITAVPDQTRHRQLKRVQAQSSPERLRRRQIRRHGYSPEEVRARIPDHAAVHLDLPYLELGSRSTGQRFRLFLQHGPLLDTPQHGPFNSYGLSQTATIPWF